MRIGVLLTALLLGVSFQAVAVNKSDAQRMLKRYKCLNCHSITREKEGPSYQAIAEKYGTHPNPKITLYEHLTDPPVIVIDGKEEQHKRIESKDRAQIDNLVEWILSLK